MITALSQRLRKWRKITKRTQVEMSEFLGMAYRTYQDLEASISNASGFVRLSLNERMTAEGVPFFKNKPDKPKIQP